MPKISVIILSNNSQNVIEATIKSVINQTCRDFELILADGNSCDETLKIAGNFKSDISKWISEPERSPFDSMNKGILLSQGEYILFLKAGDVLSSQSTLSQAVKAFEENKNTDIFFGDTEVLTSQNNRKIIKKIKKLNKKEFFLENIFLSSEFISRELLENLGGFDTRFKFEADKEFNLRAVFTEKATLKSLNFVVSTVSEDNNKNLSAKTIRRKYKEKAVIKKSYLTKLENMFFPLLKLLP